MATTKVNHVVEMVQIGAKEIGTTHRELVLKHVPNAIRVTTYNDWKCMTRVTVYIDAKTLTTLEIVGNTDSVMAYKVTPYDKSETGEELWK